MDIYIQLQLLVVTILYYNIFTQLHLHHAPNNILVSAVNFYSKALTFSWSPVTSDCPSLHYNILSSNCGSCPATTTHTTVTCTDVPTDGSVCTFAVQTVICGNIVGDSSDSVNVTTFLKEDDQATEIQGESTPELQSKHAMHACIHCSTA